MTLDVTKTATESFEYYMGDLNVEVETQTYERPTPSFAVMHLASEIEGEVGGLVNSEPIMLSASEPGPLPLQALIRTYQVISGASASSHLIGHIIAVAAGQTGVNNFTLIPLAADDAPVRERMREITGARALVESRLDSFSELPDGWLDGEGVAPTAAALATARDLIRVLLTLNFPRPRVAPTPDGGVEAEWSMGDREVSVMFEPDGALYGNSVDVTTGELTEPELNPDDHHAVADFVLGPNA